MQDESQPIATQPLTRPVAGHLFTFEEKIFGMSLTQLLMDLGVLTGSFSVTGALPLLARLILCALLTGLAMIVIHSKVEGMALGSWLYVLLRAKLLPRRYTWRSVQMDTQPGKKGSPSVQAAWLPIETLSAGIAGMSYPRKQGELVRFWAALEIAGKNIRLLPESEQVRIFRRFEDFLTGLQFHVQLLSSTEQIDPHTTPALTLQQEALAGLARTPRLASLQQASVRVQEQALISSTRSRHFVILSASSGEAAFGPTDGERRSLFALAVRLFTFQKAPQVTRAQVLEQLQVRISIVQKALAQLELRVWLLEDKALLQLFTHCLAPGIAEPTFVPEMLDTRTPTSQPSSTTQKPDRKMTTPAHTTLNYKKSVQGLHGTFYYSSSSKHARFEEGMLAVADLLAPSAVTLHPNTIEVQAGSQTRYTRTVTVTGYGHHLHCGWMNALHDLGLPLLVSTHLEPIDTRQMILKLELALTRLESKRLADQRTLRLTRADQHIEAEQIRQVTRALAAQQLKIFDVSLTICVHAGTLERLEQRTRYLLSHLRDMQIQARPARYQQDLAWRSCLPTGLDHLQQWVKLTSDVVSTMLPGTSGTVGTPTGVLLGFTGSERARQPVYLNPWSEEKKLANPHVVVIGETGQGKSWLGKTIVTGYMGLGLADVVVLDKDDDYLPLHEKLGRESQRYNLARSCPINLFDLPFGPRDIDPDDSADILAEFFDNSLLTGLALLVSDEQTPLTRGEEAYFTRVAQATYADHGITAQTIREDPETVLLPPPTLSDFIGRMQRTHASSESMQQSLLERLEKAAYLFQAGQTSISLTTPLTTFSIKGLDPKWFALMTYVVQNVLMRHRALRRDERYLAYVVEEASYLLKHPAGRRYLEQGSRGFRKLGIAQITLSQHPRDFLEAGQVVLSNAGTVFYLGMERTAVEKLNLPEQLARILTQSVPGQGVMRIGNEYAPLTIWSNPVYRDIFTTDPVEQRAMRHKKTSGSLLC